MVSAEFAFGDWCRFVARWLAQVVPPAYNEMPCLALGIADFALGDWIKFIARWLEQVFPLLHNENVFFCSRLLVQILRSVIGASLSRCDWGRLVLPLS